MRWLLKYKADHIVFWAITILFHAYVTTNLIKEADLFQYRLNILMRNGLLILVCYANIYYLFPFFFKKNKYIMYSALVMCCLLLYTFLKNAHDVWLFNYIHHNVQKQNFFTNTFYNFSIALFYMSFTTALHLSKSWYQQYLLLQKIQLEKLQTELQYLKAQINPHFLFNSINTIYFQIDKSNTEARHSLQKFSEMLRYQLYECNEEMIEIEKEIEYLKNYIDLQRLRKQKNYDIHFELGNDLHHFSIAPLLLISFVENAFKHVSNYADKTNSIHVELNRSNGHVLFNVVNTKAESASVSVNSIGLKNVQRRLELLYNNRHDLKIINEPSLFSVHLKLQLS